MSKVYYSYILIMVLFNALIWITPFLAQANDPITSSLYSGFSYTCHQLTARSVCLFNSTIGDCMPQDELFSSDRSNIVTTENGKGYKFPVDVRDMAIYAAMLVFGLILPFLTNIKSDNVPNVFILLLAAAPVAVDGFTQLFGWRESTNGIRLITGIILGAAIPFFLIPLINFFVNKLGKKKQTDTINTVKLE